MPWFGSACRTTYSWYRVVEHVVAIVLTSAHACSDCSFCWASSAMRYADSCTYLLYEVLGHVGIRRSHASIGLWIIARLPSVCLPTCQGKSQWVLPRSTPPVTSRLVRYRLVLSRRSACSDSRVNKHPHKLYFTVSCFRSIIILFCALLSSRSLVALPTVGLVHHRCCF